MLRPYFAGDAWLVSGLDVLWGLGELFVVLLGPVAAGLAGGASLVALWDARCRAAGLDAPAAPGHSCCSYAALATTSVDRQGRRSEGRGYRLTLRPTAGA